MSAGETPARARIKVKDEAEFERWRKLAEKRRRKRESVVCVSTLSDQRPAPRDHRQNEGAYSTPTPPRTPKTLPMYSSKGRSQTLT
jgi:hypothetical protein